MPAQEHIVLVNKDGAPILWKGGKRGDAYVAKRIPDYASAIMAGKVWRVQDLTTTAALAAAPATVAGLVAQNPTKDLYYVVFGVSGFVDVVPATLGYVSVWQCAHKLGVANLIRDITLASTGAGSINGAKAGQAYGGQIILDRGATVIDDGWTPTPLQIDINVGTTNFTAKEALLSVPVVIPPGLHYSLAAIAPAITFEAGLGLVWGEFTEDELE